jgi:acyltransferase
MLRVNVLKSKVNPKRIAYYDIAKGLLIMFVVIGHIKWRAECANISITPEINMTYDISSFWWPFFMPAFFFITGRCSNFHLNLKDSIINNFRTLIIPSFLLGLINCWISNLFNLDFTVKHYLWLFSWRIIFVHGGGNWFLVALFLSKVIYSLILKKLQFIKCTLFIFVLYVIGIYCYNMKVCNVWYFQHAFILMIYLHLGYISKNYKERDKMYSLMFIVYILIWIFLRIMNVSIPQISSNIDLDFNTVFYNLLLSITGTLGIIGLSCLLKYNKILETLGRNSLAIYCLHFAFLTFFLQEIDRYKLNQKIYFVLFIAMIVLTIVCCLVINRFLQSNKLKFIVGK